jgi:hypothetical protein
MPLQVTQVQPAPAPPAPPAVREVFVNGQPITGPQAVYQAFQAQRRELTRQLSGLEDQRREVANRLRQGDATNVEKAGLEARLTLLDERIARTMADIATADANVASAAGVPGAVVPPTPPRRDGPPEEVLALGVVFLLVAVLPLSIAWARRIWRRGAAPTTEMSTELSDRFSRLEQALDAVAIEVERIGEGQRYMAQRLGPGAAEAIPVPQRSAIPR